MKEILYKELAYRIVGCFYNVYNELGPGYKESIYQEALTIEFGHNTINFVKEKRITITYRNKKAGIYTPDFIVDDIDIRRRIYEKARKDIRDN